MDKIIIALPPGSFIGYPFNEPAILLGILKKYNPELVELNLDLMNYFLINELEKIKAKLTETYKENYSEELLMYYVGRIFYKNNIKFIINKASEDYFIESCVKKIQKKNPNVIIFIFQFLRGNPLILKWISHLGMILKNQNNILIGAAGSDLTTFIEEDLDYIEKNLPGIDFLIRGNPESIIFDIIDSLSNLKKKTSIPGMTIFHQQYFSHLDLEFAPYPTMDYPLPDWSQVRSQEYLNFRIGTRIFSVASSRGCNYRCKFCDETIKMGNYNVRDINLVFEEIKELKSDQKANIIRFTDSLLNTDPSRLLKLAEKLKELNVYWVGMMRMDNYIDRNYFSKLYQSGCRGLWFGLESVSNKTQKRLSKFAKPKIGSQNLLNAKKTDINIILLLISNIPFETKKDIEKTFRFLKKNHKNIHSIHLESFRLMQSTEIWKNYANFNIKSFIKEPLNTECSYIANNINYDKSLRDLWYSIKDTTEIILPNIEKYTIVTEL